MASEVNGRNPATADREPRRRLPRRRNFLVFALGSAVIAIGYMRFAISDGLMLILGFPVGFFASGIFSGMGPLYTALFPTTVRAAGQGFC